MAAGNREAVIRDVTSIAERVASSEGLEIVDVALLGGGRNRVLRVFIDKPGGVTHADCETVSRQMSAILDVEDTIPGGAYTLEISSPGVERPLRKMSDFERFVGQKAKVALRQPIGNQRHWTGRLASAAGGTITLEADGKPIQFTLDQVEKANLKFEW